jgi:hypothetical protein
LAAGLAALGLAAGVASPARAASWGGITPGETTRTELLAHYGPPTQERSVVEEGHTVPELTYAGSQAPPGLVRMVVSFGLIRSGQLDPDLVRALTIYPEARVFTAAQIAIGWGTPEAIGADEQTKRSVIRYESKGLFVVMDPTGSWAEMMLFAPVPPAAR